MSRQRKPHLKRKCPEIMYKDIRYTHITLPPGNSCKKQNEKLYYTWSF